MSARVIRRPSVTEGQNSQDKWARPVDPEWNKRFKKAMILAKELQLSDEDRYDLARVVPTVDQNGDGSWKDLTQTQLDYLLNMLEGYIFITYMKSQGG